MSSHAIVVRDLSKSYSIARNESRYTTLAEAFVARLRNPLQRTQREIFWALRNVSFEVNQGDTIGIIGRNGAGKSTLLKILSRIVEPTTGHIQLFGRIGSLLEVGTGFHPELTGRENVYLNGAILGMRKRDIDRQFDAIIDFAGIERFLDTPVKRYSSGMYVRLAFAVAAHLDSEILVVDEVLAVGDAEFQQKCLGKMKDVSHSGRTVLFVSHNMQAVSLLCNKGVFLKQGEVTYSGNAQGVISEYLASFHSNKERNADPTARYGTGEYRFTHVHPAKQTFSADEPKEIQYRIQRFGSRVGRMYLAAHIVDEMGAIVTQCDSRLVGHWLEDAESIEGKFSFTTPWLKPGNYRVDLYLCIAGLIDCFEDACTLNISPLLPYPNSVADDGIGKGTVLGDYAWESWPSNDAPARADASALVDSEP